MTARRILVSLGLITLLAMIWLSLQTVLQNTEDALVEYGTTPIRSHLPSECRHLERDPDPATWDPITETYPPNEEWENCMGVGRGNRN